MGALIIGVIVVVVLASVVLVAALHIVQQYERAVVFRFGRVTGEKGPGLAAIVPFINVLRKVSFRVDAHVVAGDDPLRLDRRARETAAVAKLPPPSANGRALGQQAPLEGKDVGTQTSPRGSG
jgi:regulator of protease activity HflC (stomatin/prohibitin superfamily)